MKMGNHCVVSKFHSDFVYVDFRMCEQNTLSKLYGNLPQTSSLWHRDALVNGRVTRSFGRICLRARPQDDNVFLAGGFAPCTPIRNCKHSCLTIIVHLTYCFSIYKFVSSLILAQRDITLSLPSADQFRPHIPSAEWGGDSRSRQSRCAGC